MLPPEKDIASRSSIWNCMQMLFMDVDPELELESISEVCANSKYSLVELEKILINEVQPSLRSNLLMVTIPEWRGYQIEDLTELILDKHRFGKRKQIFFTRYSQELWGKLEKLISEKRKSS